MTGAKSTRSRSGTDDYVTISAKDLEELIKKAVSDAIVDATRDLILKVDDLK